MIKIELQFFDAKDIAPVLAVYEEIDAKRKAKFDEEISKAGNSAIFVEPPTHPYPAPGVYNEEQAAEISKPRNMQAVADAIVSRSEPVPKEEPSSPKPDESAAPGEFQDITYDDLKSSIMKLVAKSPAEMKKVCEAFGLKTFAGTTDKLLWAKAKAMIDAKVAG